MDITKRKISSATVSFFYNWGQNSSIVTKNKKIAENKTEVRPTKIGIQTNFIFYIKPLFYNQSPFFMKSKSQIGILH